LTLDTGVKWELEPFQREIAADVLSGVRETLVLIPKGNAKTTLLAGIALHHLLTVPDASVPIGAASREQAGILYRQASGFIRRNPQLEQFLKPQDGYRRILNTVNGGILQVYASDADTGDGVIPTLALVDELHRHKDDGLYGVWADGLGKRGGQIVTISTAGDDEDSPLGVMRSQALKMPGVKRDGAHTIARSKDFVMHEWACDPTDDLHDLRVVKRANPLKAVTLDELRMRRDSPTMTPWRWARFACGVWTAGEKTWMQPADWDACKGTVQLDEADRVWMGVDIGQVRDSSAVITAGWVDDKLHVSCKAWEPPPEVQILEVEAHIERQADKYDVAEIAYDPWRFKRSAEVLEERGLMMVEFPQTQSRMAQGSSVLYDLIREGKLVHDGDELLRRHVLAGVAAETESGWRVSKKKSGKKIDACIALVLAASRAVHGRTDPAALLLEVFS
jgi:phage terminase large subunit-like protein